MADINARGSQNLSLAIGCMKPSLKTKLRIVEAAINSDVGMARYGPATEEVKVSESAFMILIADLEHQGYGWRSIHHE
jgi:hypothetical protein